MEGKAKLDGKTKIQTDSRDNGDSSNGWLQFGILPFFDTLLLVFSAFPLRLCVSAVKV